MLVGPVFTREAATLPRRPRLFVARTLYVAVLFGLMVTAWLILIGNQQVRNVGDWARFGGKLFAIIAPLQLAIVALLAALVAAAAVAQEKDRLTLVLLRIAIRERYRRRKREFRCALRRRTPMCESP